MRFSIDLYFIDIFIYFIYKNYISLNFNVFFLWIKPNLPFFFCVDILLILWLICRCGSSFFITFFRISFWILTFLLVLYLFLSSVDLVKCWWIIQWNISINNYWKHSKEIFFVSFGVFCIDDKHTLEFWQFFSLVSLK